MVDLGSSKGLSKRKVLSCALNTDSVGRFCRHHNWFRKVSLPLWFMFSHPKRLAVQKKSETTLLLNCHEACTNTCKTSRYLTWQSAHKALRGQICGWRSHPSQTTLLQNHCKVKCTQTLAKTSRNLTEQPAHKALRGQICGCRSHPSQTTLLQNHCEVKRAQTLAKTSRHLTWQPAREALQGQTCGCRSHPSLFAGSWHCGTGTLLACTSQSLWKMHTISVLLITLI